MSQFFHVSKNSYLEAFKLYNNPRKDYAVRIINIYNGMQNFTYLPDMTHDELVMLGYLIKMRPMTNIQSYDHFIAYVSSIH